MCAGLGLATKEICISRRQYVNLDKHQTLNYVQSSGHTGIRSKWVDTPTRDLLASGVGALAFTAQSCVETLELQSTKYTRAQTKRRSYIICTHWWAKINKVSAQASVCIEYGETMMKKGLWGKQEEKRDEAEVERHSINGCAICQNCMFSGEFNTLSFFRRL